MTDALDVDVVVVGLGPGGEYVAQKLAEAGMSVVGVERDLVGGECPYYGCVPSKMMVRAADLVAEVWHADHLAGPAQVRPEWPRVAERIRRQATNDWSDESHVERLTGAGVSLVRGTGRLAGPGRVVVETGDGTRELVARRGVVLGTGTCPAEPPIDGLAGTPYWTNREIVRADTLPASLAVIGGGTIGCELAQAFARFGSRVTVLEAADRILSAEEPETSALIGRLFADEGIDVRTGVDIERVDHDGGFRVRLAAGEAVEADHLLVATGRTPNLAGLGLETVGLDADVAALETDDRMRAGDRLWAVGDITGVGAFTHVAVRQGAVVVGDLLERGGPCDERHAVSRVTFTDPEVGAVGLTEAQAREAGIDVRTARADLSESSRGWIHQVGADGLVKLVADAATGTLVGATSVGPSGGEVLGLLALGVHARLPVATIRGMHFAYPTFHRAIESALDDLDL